MSSLADVRPGDLMFTDMTGGAGLIVGTGQLLLAVAEPGMIWRQGVARWWRKRHVGVVVEASPPGLHQPRLVQAMPGGVEEIELTTERHWSSHTVFLRPNYIMAGPGFALDTVQGQEVADAAKRYGGTPYDFATYAAIPAWRRGLRTERIKQIISGTDTMMCSRLADAALRDAGWHAFADGRLPGDVTPSELYRAVLEAPGTIVLGAGIL